MVSSCHMKAIAQPSDLPLSPHCRVQALLRSQLGCIGLDRLDSGSVGELCGTPVGTIPPIIPCTRLVLLPHGRSTSPTLPTPGSAVQLSLGFWQNLGQPELCGYKIEANFTSHANWCKTFSSHCQILVCLDLINSARLTLTIS